MSSTGSSPTRTRLCCSGTARGAGVSGASMRRAGRQHRRYVANGTHNALALWVDLHATTSEPGSLRPSIVGSCNVNQWPMSRTRPHGMRQCCRQLNANRSADRKRVRTNEYWYAAGTLSNVLSRFSCNAIHPIHRACARRARPSSRAASSALSSRASRLASCRRHGLRMQHSESADRRVHGTKKKTTSWR